MICSCSLLLEEGTRRARQGKFVEHFSSKAAVEKVSASAHLPPQEVEKEIKVMRGKCLKFPTPGRG